MPYYIDNYPEFENKKVRIFLKYNNDNNPFYVATITPQTLLSGLTKIGGYITIFGLLKIALFVYNQYSFETKLLKKYKEKIKDSLDDNFDLPIDKKTIRELMSYEMLMELILTHLRERKGTFTLDQIHAGDSDSINYNTKNASSSGDDEDRVMLHDIENIQNDLTKEEPGQGVKKKKAGVVS